jgi:hypothetical protein
MRKKKNTELHSLLARVEALPPEPRQGLVRFLELVLSLESRLEEYAPPGLRSGDREEDLSELRGILERHLQNGSPIRRGLALEVLACAEKAYALGQEDPARLLLQVGIVLAAGEEQVASFILQNAACSAALEMVRATR